MFKKTSAITAFHRLTRQMSQSRNPNSIFMQQNENGKLNAIQPPDLLTPVDSYSDLTKLDNKIAQLLHDKVQFINHSQCEPGEEDSFFVCDLDEVKRVYHHWCASLPRVKPYYAIKCNNDPQLLNTLIQLGAGFDCASKGEFDTMLNMGVSPDRIVYANPCKALSYVRSLKENGINLTTFDNSDELFKMAKFHPTSKLLLRIITDDSTAQCQLSTKFGASMPQAVELLRLAKELQLDVCGVAFHVGSGSSDPRSLRKAIDDSKILFELGTSIGFNMNILDIGGGFTLETFDRAAQTVNEALESKFPELEHPELKIIAEPGRLLCASLFTLACHVIGKRSYFHPESGQEKHMIYLNDGVYGNLNCIIYDHQLPVAKTLTHNGRFHYGDEADYDSEVSIWGPTCDGLDCISESAQLKFVPQIGDWIYFSNIGAYTSAASTSFNGFSRTAEVTYV